MSNVRILPEILSNKIAAGEVVERPSSVVKELVENALDAGSTLITVDIDNGGKSLIRISDNGSGMTRDDALMSIERYATSKIYNDDDLFSIHTLGFRGEALPSIASVSRFTLVTRDKNSDTGTMIHLEGGKVRKVSETAAPVGTMISVEQLFFNTPARRKFLKTTGTEIAHILDTLSSIALGWPQVQFKLTHNGKPVKSWPPALGYYDRAVDVLGHELHNHALEIRFDDGYLDLEGFVSSPDITRGSTQRIFLFINGRVIRDRSLIHALIDSYGSRLMKGRFPVAVLFLRLPFDELDVNVHPTKHEVRFVDQNRIFTSVKSAVSDALIQAERKSVKSVSRFVEHRPAVSFRPALERDLFPRHSLPAIHNDNRIKEEPPVFHSSPSGVKDLPTIEPNMPEPLDRFTTDPSPPPNQGMEHGTQNQTFFSGLRIIGQLHNSYILCDSGEGLVIIDQHAAHERIVFEDLKKRSSGVRSQDLLLPETVELGYKEAEALETVIPSLTELGLEIEPFGGNCFAVKSVPAMLSTASVTRLIVEIAEKMVEVGSSKALEIALDDCLIVMSCHGAIRANKALSDVQIRHLLRQMDDCESPSFCPHGRPTWTRYSIKSIEKSFKR